MSSCRQVNEQKRRLDRQKNKKKAGIEPINIRTLEPNSRTSKQEERSYLG